ncbi:MAG: ABC transporter ATP-binding protein [Gemmatimonadota bacterium]|nr:MAG: ABC transporter ATP-binding protein [Gemmatimonadota bacterium]
MNEFDRPQADASENAVEVRDVVTRFGRQVVHDGISFDIRRGEIFALVGGSGSGKSTLMREILQLERPTEGSIRVFGRDLQSLRGADALALKTRLGVLFQGGALFGSLTVLENIGLPLREHTTLDPKLIEQIGTLKIALVGLPPEAGSKYPSELSGGMIKRSALARALALDAELLLLDEPTSGLDPAGARALDRLVLQLRRSLGLTVLVITHDVESIRLVADRVGMLAGGKLLALGPVAELENSADPFVRGYFQGAAATASRTVHPPGRAGEPGGGGPAIPRRTDDLWEE